ncbi:WD40-repeat-containing domain protein [Blastocladiella britannica]|nr:WD40-repeat-containing domain protein [Blastocladiella britannica]
MSTFRALHARELADADVWDDWSSETSLPPAADFDMGNRHRTASVPEPWAVSAGPRNFTPWAARMATAATAEGHSGCVNTVRWSADGQLLLSGSDDRTLRLWDGRTMESISTIPTAHRRNIFAAEFLATGDCHDIVSCSVDGLVLHTRLDPSLSSAASTGRFACHFDTANKVLADPEAPWRFLSCGTDGRIMHYDLRESSQCLCSTGSDGSTTPCTRHLLFDYRPSGQRGSRPGYLSLAGAMLHFSSSMSHGVATIAFVPGHPHALALATCDDKVSVIDERAPSAGPIYQWRPPFHGAARRRRVNHKITDMRWDEGTGDGVEVLVNFSEERVWLVRPDWAAPQPGSSSTSASPSFTSMTNVDDTTPRDPQVVQVFQGHRNECTMLKEAAFFGSAHIAAGSDDGNVYLWHRGTGDVVDVLCHLDSSVVNCVQPHPFMPSLAISGIDDTIKHVQPTADPDQGLTENHHVARDGVDAVVASSHRHHPHLVTVDPASREQVTAARKSAGSARLRRIGHALERNARMAARFSTSSTDTDGDDDDDEDDEGGSSQGINVYTTSTELPLELLQVLLGLPPSESMTASELESSSDDG